jgi:DNA-binding MarR family transcriptional regulator
MTDHDAQFDAILDQLEAAGMVEVYTDDDGEQAMRLTPDA